MATMKANNARIKCNRCSASKSRKRDNAEGIGTVFLGRLKGEHLRARSTIKAIIIIDGQPTRVLYRTCPRQKKTEPIKITHISISNEARKLTDVERDQTKNILEGLYGSTASNLRSTP